jgi:hypothetical protein
MEEFKPAYRFGRVHRRAQSSSKLWLQEEWFRMVGFLETEEFERNHSKCKTIATQSPKAMCRATFREHVVVGRILT